MTKQKTCKTKGCENPVLKGKYCKNCAQKHKEKKEAGAAVAALGLAGTITYFVKKEGPEKILEFGKTAVNTILKK